MGIELVLLVVIGVLVVGLVMASRRRRLFERDLREISTALGATPDGPSLVAALDRLTARLATATRERAHDRADLRVLGETLPIGALRFGADGRVDFATASAHLLLDRAPNGLIGRSVMEAFTDVRADDLIRSAAATPEGQAPPSPIELSPASLRRLTLRARRSESGATWALIEDVTELRNLQRIRAEFIDNVSHELRTPLTTVSLLAETLAREADAAAVPARMKERIGKIEVEMGHLVQMVNELLDLSKIEAGTSLSITDEVDLGRLARTSTERLRLFAERQGVDLRVELEDDLPPVRADEDRIGQVFVNLVHNAVKFSPDGGEVVVSVRRVDDLLAASVHDRGVGIPRADRRRIFERFYKVDRSRARGTGGGTGLGLSIVRHVVEQHGGRVSLRSEEGRGSTFTFTIPLASTVTAPTPALAGTAGRGR